MVSTGSSSDDVAYWPFARPLTIAEALMAEQINTLIASTPERARRAEWAGVPTNAASSPIPTACCAAGMTPRGLSLPHDGCAATISIDQPDLTRLRA
jgi:hypothetical protein